MSEQKVIDKIKKLFALANCEGASKNEAETALRMANKLLDKHSVSMIDLADDDAVSLSFLEGINRNWVKGLFNSISQLYDCKYFYDKNWDTPKHVVVGTNANRLTVSIICEQLIDQIQKETKGKSNNYKLSAVNSLFDTCMRIIKERESSTEEIMPGTGLIPIDLIKRNFINNQDFINEKIGGLSKGKASKFNYDSDGANYGKGLNPGARVTGKNNRISN